MSEATNGVGGPDLLQMALDSGVDAEFLKDLVAGKANPRDVQQLLVRMLENNPQLAPAIQALAGRSRDAAPAAVREAPASAPVAAVGAPAPESLVDLLNAVGKRLNRMLVKQFGGAIRLEVSMMGREATVQAFSRILVEDDNGDQVIEEEPYREPLRFPPEKLGLAVVTYLKQVAEDIAQDEIDAREISPEEDEEEAPEPPRRRAPQGQGRTQARR